jgi:ABC-type glycerol-3-phosphate transport system substrate-binding protein
MMSPVRRTVSGFLLALVVAAGLVLTPAQAQAEESAYCAFLANAIEFWSNKPNAPQNVVDALIALYEAHCSAE